MLFEMINFITGICFVILAIVYFYKILLHLKFLKNINGGKLTVFEIRRRAGEIKYEDSVTNTRADSEAKSKINRVLTLLRITLMIFLVLLLIRLLLISFWQYV